MKSIKYFAGLLRFVWTMHVSSGVTELCCRSNAKNSKAISQERWGTPWHWKENWTTSSRLSNLRELLPQIRLFASRTFFGWNHLPRFDTNRRGKRWYHAPGTHLRASASRLRQRKGRPWHLPGEPRRLSLLKNVWSSDKMIDSTKPRPNLITSNASANFAKAAHKYLTQRSDACSQRRVDEARKTDLVRCKLPITRRQQENCHMSTRSGGGVD